MQNKQLVTIKGTKDGLMFLLDDNCGYTQLLEELSEKLSIKHYQNTKGPKIKVKVNIGYRYLTENQIDELTDVITDGRNLIIDKIDSNVITIEEAEEIRQKSQMVTLTKVIRSGQVIKIYGDLLLIGDVNPGGKVMATGNIYIMGALKGIAHAGMDGNEECVISASMMVPTQLRISERIYHFDKKEQLEYVMGAAFIHRETSEFVLGKVQQLIRHRPNLQQNLLQVVE